MNFGRYNKLFIYLITFAPRANERNAACPSQCSNNLRFVAAPIIIWFSHKGGGGITEGDSGRGS